MLMQVIKYFNKVTVFVSLLFLNQIAHASIVEGKCGGTIIQIKITKENGYFVQFKLFYKINVKESKFFYSPQADSLYVACVQTKAKKDLLLMELICSGSACTDEGVYEIFDPATKKMLIKYKRNEELARIPDEIENRRKIEKILGYTPPLLELLSNLVYA